MRKVRNKKRKNERDERRNERQKKKRTRERERNKADECGKETTTTVSRFGARWPRAVKSVQIDTNRMPSDASRGEVIGTRILAIHQNETKNRRTSSAKREKNGTRSKVGKETTRRGVTVERKRSI